MSNLRMLYASNAFWCASGYGVQGKSLLPRLATLPEFDGRSNVAMFAWYGLQGGMHEVDGFRIYPQGGDPYGNDVIGAHTRHFEANVVVSLIDVWVMHNTAKSVAPALWLPWLPIDHTPVPQRVLDSLAGAYLPLTYSKWGHKLLKQAGVHNHYIPHGVETDVFRVLPDDERLRDFKRNLTGIDDAHLTVIVAANKGYPDRKAFQVQLRAWAAFAADKPHARLYIHSEIGTIYGGVDFQALIRACGIEPGRVCFPDRYMNMLGYPPEYLAVVYNAADVYMGNSMSEGFGIPLVEAQACGCPVVTTDFSAMPELVRWGKAVAPLDMVWTPMNAWQAWPDARGIVTALEELHAEWLDAERGHGDGWRIQQFAAQDAIHAEYDWDAIVRDQWTPLVAELAEIAPPLERPLQVTAPPMPPEVRQAPIHANGNLHAMGVTRVEVTA
jgi:glycosyltransferase involved in cell wall biosynthesis